MPMGHDPRFAPDPEPTGTASTRPEAPSGPGEGAGEAEERVLLPDRYRLGALLGQGGYGRVYAARDRVLDRDVAIKVMFHRSAVWFRRFEREVSVLRLLDLPGVVGLLDSGGTEGACWFVMDRVDGHPFPGRPAPLAWDDLRETALEFLRSLARLHSAGIVHRDLKPSNVLVRPDGSPVILDLGLARGGGHKGTAGEEGGFAGTPLYMSPEQLEEGPIDSRSDLYAAGLMLCRALTGELPHPGNSDEDRIYARLGRRAPPMRELCPGLPGEVAEALDSMLARRADGRPASALQVVRRIAGRAPSLPVIGAGAGGAGGRGPGLESLFSGPERLFHIPSDAAAALRLRAAPGAGGLGEEIELWIALGLARRTGQKIEISRRDLDRLNSGLLPGGPATAPRELRESLARGDEERTAEAAIAAAGVEASFGRLGTASLFLREGLRACWRTEDRDLETRLLDRCVDLALTERTLGAIDGAIDLIGRARVTDPEALAILHSGRALQAGRKPEALELLAGSRTQGRPGLERWKWELLVQATVDGPLEGEKISKLDADIGRWARQPGSGRDPKVHLYRWRARLLYRQGRMREAGEMAERAAKACEAPIDRLQALLAAAKGWIEAADVPRTLAIGQEALDLAADLRLPHMEAQAEWFMRSAANRTGSAEVPDLELARCAGLLGAPHIEGLIQVTEAAIAWRSGHPAALELAVGARMAFEAAGYRAAMLFAQALELAAAPADPATALEVAQEACAARRADVAVEVLGILARAGLLSGDWRAAFEEQAGELPTMNPDWRAGAMSMNEARAAVVAAAQGPRTALSNGEGGSR